jgi:DNA-binding LacI/PurR family transcriptional regulator
MSRLDVSSGAQQVAEYLRGELQQKRWIGTMPGRSQLAKELGISGKLVEAALVLLEQAGLLASQGLRRRRSITLQDEKKISAALRVGILLYGSEDRKSDYILELVQKLQEQGHCPFFTDRNLTGLRMDVRRIAAFVAQNPADAWVVMAGSHDVLEWFSRQPTPAFALFGRLLSVHIAGTGSLKSTTMGTVVRRLTALGHSRIVFLTREVRRKPDPGIVERAFLEELQAQGIATGPYNLPDWEDNQEGFSDCLSSLFQSTPPTALIVSTMEMFYATQQFLLHHGIRVPQDISIVSTDYHPTFTWCHPAISHIKSDSSVWVRDVVRWVNKVAHGKDDRHQQFSTADFVEGGTIGPVKVE